MVNDKRLCAHTEYYRTLADTKRWRFLKDVEYMIKESEYRMRKAGINNTHTVLRNMAIGCLLYITGARVSEITDIKLKDLMIYETRLHEKFMSFDLINRKNKKQKFKRVIGNFKNEKYFINLIYKHYKQRVADCFIDLNAKKLIYGQYDNESEDIMYVLDQYLFTSARAKDNNTKMCKDWFGITCKRAFHVNAHTFRKIRLTHLVIHYGMSAKEIQNFAGHSGISSAEPYVNITNKDFEAKMNFIAR